MGNENMQIRTEHISKSQKGLNHTSVKKKPVVGSKYFNRDLSWLQFNHRVLQEAQDEQNPLFERIKFLAIFSSNLDEFYKVRVSNILKLKQLHKDLRKKLISKPNKLLKLINQEAAKQQQLSREIFKNSILPELDRLGFKFVESEKFDESQEDFARTYYKKIEAEINVLKTEIGERSHLFVENEQLYLVGEAPNNGLYWIKIPDKLERFVTFPPTGNTTFWTFLDDVLCFNLKKCFGTDFYSVRVSRDAELYIEDEYSGNLLEKIEEAISTRSAGHVTRALVNANIPDATLKKVMQIAELDEENILKGSKYQNFKSLINFPNLKRLERYEPLPPLVQKELLHCNSVFDAVLEKDRLFYYPYETFDHLLQLISESANDPTVTKIMATLYRISKNSMIVQRLIEAAKKGKELFIFIETKARFDEENNIRWGKILAEHGAKVKYSYPGIKVHSKILYIERIRNDNVEAISYIGTGNLNENTARVYTDFGLMTAHKKITKEVNQVFNVLQGKIVIPKTKRLLVSPFNARNRFVEMVENETKLASKGKEAYIILKMNSLQDYKMINLLYDASSAGVKIWLLVRGVCCLVPGIKGFSENITVRSIVGRFLEHGRVFIFGNGGTEKMFMGSADWMTRNLDHRIEVITPIFDKELHKKVRKTIELQMEDTVKSRILDSDQSNNYVPNLGEVIDSQHKIYNALSR